MRKLIIAALATAVLAPASFFGGPASAETVPQAASATKFQQLIQQDHLVTQYARAVYRGSVGVRGGYRGGYRNVAYGRRGVYGGGRYAYGRPYGGYYRRGGYYGYGAAAGVAAGALAAGALASQPVVTGSVAPAGVNYCAQRFRSYNPATGTYTGYDGLQHPCP